MSNVFETVSYLVDLGLTQLQARVYVTVLQRGRVRGREIAAELNLVRPAVYRTLDELLKKGLIRKNLTKPATYFVTEPRESLRTLLDVATARVDRLRELFGEALQTAYSVRTFEELGEGEFRILPTRHRLVPTTMSMLSRAKSSYLGVYGKLGMMLFSTGAVGRDVIIAAKKRGVKMKIIADIEKSNLRQGRFVSKFAIVRRASDLEFYLDVVDHCELLMGPAVEDQLNMRASVDLWTNSRSFIRAMEGMFESLWQNSRPFRD